ncbi:methylenetetrahydrofolate reductase [Stenotrophomonas indicatrix]|uniref:methylenetetrahydrofolate reductase n=1 Tax=Stenotrophomonas indicatrix TaxID=2045451 RepID=UPI0028AEE33E|nr:methylenetetrahydrofolate reductase [Stenotrophomonas indicatrix]
MSAGVGRMEPLAQTFVNAFSLEVSAKAMPALRAEAARIARGTTISIPYLPSEDDAARLAAARRVRELGFEPMPHLSARRIGSRAALEHFVERAVIDAGIDRCFVIAGDLATPAGPFADSTSIIESGILERAGIKVVGVGGHPQGHPVMTSAERWRVLENKCQRIEERGMAPLVITQFAFDADIVLAWLNELRARGITHPVLVGVPGPASIARLVRYAAMCGVAASTSMLSRYGISIGRLLGRAGPDVFVDRLVEGLTEAHGQVSPHLFPFGGIAPTMEWVEHYRMRAGDAHTTRSPVADEPS